MKKNCWEYKGCGQNRKGCKESLVKCPVPEMTDSNGLNGGENAGRICWIIANTMCKDGAETTFEEMIKTCSQCEFYKLVKAEEGDKMTLSLDVIKEFYEKAKAVTKSNREHGVTKRIK